MRARDMVRELASRRAAVLAGCALAVTRPGRLLAAAPTYAPGFEPARIEGLGGGADILSDNPPSVLDVAYPPSLNGTWVCEREVTSVEGNVGQAEGAWRLLGGDGSSVKDPEKYLLRYVSQPEGGSLSITGVDGRKYYGVVLDRGYELNARVHGANVTWDPRLPDTLNYERDAGGRGSAAEVSRTARPPL